jgi:hypothetical protein
MLIFIIMGAISLTMGCSSSDFEASSKANKLTEDKSNDINQRYGDDQLDQGDAFGQGEAFHDGTARNGTGLQTDSEIITLDEYNKNCWFAVSGTWVGASLVAKHNNVFQDKYLAGELGQGVIVDSVGGIILQARDEPYTYKAGGREIDGAVNNTFDSILVPPGMHVEIRDGSGGVVIDTDGPVIVESEFYAYQSEFIGRYHNTLSSQSGRIPSWMTDYVTNNPSLRVAPLQKARSVKVSTVAGTKCGNFSKS